MSDFAGSVQNPDDVPLYEKSEKETEISKCPGCGANLSFNPEKECLCCEHCGTSITFESRVSKELPFSRIADEGNKWTDTHVFQCNNCGAKEILARSEIAKSCSFCGTTNIVKTEDLSGLKPNAVLPFKITKENAIQRVVAWAKKKFFAPKRFKKEVRPEEVSGVYNPAFTFDTDTVSNYTGKLGKRVTYTTRQNGKTVTKTRIEYINISGTYQGKFDDILIQASTVIEAKQANKLQPFDSANSQDYNANFIHGYTANQYTKDGTACWGEARGIIDARIRSAILSRYPGYDIVVSFNANTVYNNIMFRYMLLPVYIGHCAYGTVYDKKAREKKERIFNFYVNGRNGKVAGKTPVSAGKVSIFVGILALIAAGAVIGITKFLGLW